MDFHLDFSQFEGESLPQCWCRYRELLDAYHPPPDIEFSRVVGFFIDGLDYETRDYIEWSTNGTFMSLAPEDAWYHIDDLANHPWDYNTFASPLETQPDPLFENESNDMHFASYESYPPEPPFESSHASHDEAILEETLNQFMQCQTEALRDVRTQLANLENCFDNMNARSSNGCESPPVVQRAPRPSPPLSTHVIPYESESDLEYESIDLDTDQPDALVEKASSPPIVQDLSELRPSPPFFTHFTSCESDSDPECEHIDLDTDKPDTPFLSHLVDAHEKLTDLEILEPESHEEVIATFLDFSPPLDLDDDIESEFLSTFCAPPSHFTESLPIPSSPHGDTTFLPELSFPSAHWEESEDELVIEDAKEGKPIVHIPLLERGREQATDTFEGHSVQIRRVEDECEECLQVETIEANESHIIEESEGRSLPPILEGGTCESPLEVELTREEHDFLDSTKVESFYSLLESKVDHSPPFFSELAFASRMPAIPAPHLPL